MDSGRLNDFVGAQYAGLKEDLLSLQRGDLDGKDALVDSVTARLEALSEARASFNTWADSKDIDLEKLSHQAPLKTLGYDLEADLSSMSSADIIALVASMFKMSDREQRETLAANLKTQQVSTVSGGDVDTSTADGARLSALIETLDWVPAEVTELATAVANLGLREGDGNQAINASRDLVRQLGFTQLANAALLSENISPFRSIDQLLERLSESEEESIRAANSVLNEASIELSTVQVEALVQALTKGILAVAATSAGIAENMTLTREQEQDLRAVQDQEIRDQILNQSAELFDPTTFDSSLQAVVDGPGAGRRDLVLLNAVLDANADQFQALFSVAAEQGTRLQSLVETWDLGETLKGHTPGYA